MEQLEHYKYFILDKKNNSVSGVISDDYNLITYHQLCILKKRNSFSGYEEDILAKYPDSHEREINKYEIPRLFGEEVELTKDYWTAWEHATGRKRKVVARATEC